MTYSDPDNLLHVCWYGYSTGWGAEGDWIFPGMAHTCYVFNNYPSIKSVGNKKIIFQAEKFNKWIKALWKCKVKNVSVGNLKLEK